MITNIDLLADRLKGIKFNGEELTPGKFIELISSEEEAQIEADSVHVFDDSELEGLKERVGKESAKTGAKTVLEMEIKKLRNERGLEFEGKTLDNLLDAYGQKVLSEAKIPANQKIQELEGSLEKLRNQYTGELEEKENLINSLQGNIKKEKINNSIMSALPKELKGVNTKQAALLLQNDFEFDFDNDQLVVKKGGEVLKDKYENIVPFDSVIKDYVAQNGWINRDGRGGENSRSDKPKGEFKTKHDLMRHMFDNGIDPTGNEGLEMLNKFEEENAS